MNCILHLRWAASLGLFISLFVHSLLPAQGLDPLTSGSTYVIAFPDTTRNTFDSRFPNRQSDTFALYIYSAVDNVVHITSPDGYDNTVYPKGGKFETVYLNARGKRAKTLVADSIGVTGWSTFRVEAERPIIVYCYLTTKFGTEGFTPLPVESWGREYFAAAHPGEVAEDVTPGGETTYRTKNIMAPAELLITAAYDNTFIEIQPSARTVLRDNPRLMVTLRANQCYLVETFVDTISANQGGTQPDLAGTRIISNKPISVISGNTRAQLNPSEQSGLARNSFKSLCIEALTPVEQHGREFVYLPTWDSRRITGQPGEKIEDKRAAEFVRLYGTMLGTTDGTTNDSGRITNFSVDNQKVWQDRIGSPRPRVYRTDSTSQAFQSCMATVIYLGTIPGSPGFVGSSYEAYAPYMVELVAREEWSSFAPYFAPTYPPQMEHFVNIVADTISARNIFDELGVPVAFNHGAIMGTDLVWGSMAVSPGVDHYVVGRNGARFFAFAYGFGKGYELWRPGRAGKRDDNSHLAGGGDDGNHLLHPAEYEESTAQAYGYPLAPRRVVLSGGDSLIIKTTKGCGTIHYTVETANTNPLGLRTIYLDSLSTKSDITAASPDWRIEMIGSSQTEFDVVLKKGAAGDTGSVIIQDRSGKIYRVPFTILSQEIVFSEGNSVELAATKATTTRDTVVVLTNPSSSPVLINSIMLTGNPSGFLVTGTTPLLPVNLQPGQSVRVGLRFTPPAANQVYHDTLLATSICGDIRLALDAESVLACLSVNNLDFGVFELGRDGPKTLKLKLCNVGRDTLRFDNPSGGIISWLSTNFTISAGMLDTLKQAHLLRDECINVEVTFQPTQTGVFRTTAKIFNETACGLDSSQWSAAVVPPLAAPDAPRAGYAIGSVGPTPTDGRSNVSFRLGRPGDLALHLYDQRGELVVELYRTGLNSGEGSVALDASSLPAGTYLLRLSSGGWSATTTVVVVR